MRFVSAHWRFCDGVPANIAFGPRVAQRSNAMNTPVDLPDGKLLDHRLEFISVV
jgi:hypothetical protein